MKIATTLVAAMLTLALAGCSDNDSSGKDKPAPPKPEKTEASPPKVAPSTYYEEIAKDKTIYVVGSKASADKIKAGQKLASHVAAFGFGPNNEKVMFEADKEGLETRLMAEFSKRHGK